MSHTIKYRDTTFHFNAGFDGDVTIVSGDGKITVPFDDLKAFVAESVRAKLISDIESMSPDEIFRLCHLQKRGGE